MRAATGADEAVNAEEILLTVPPPRPDGLPWHILNVQPNSKPKKPVHTPLLVVPNEATTAEDDFLVTIPEDAKAGETVRWAPPPGGGEGGDDTMGSSKRYDFIVPPDAPRTLNVATPRP